VRSEREQTPILPALGAVFLLLVAGALSYLVLMASTFIASKVHGDSLRDAGTHIQNDLVNLTLAQVVGMGLALVIGLAWFGPDQSYPEALHLRPIRARSAALGLLAGACLQFPLAELANVLHHYVLGPDPLETQLALQRMIEAPSLGRGMIVVCCVVAAVPVMEELFFRGFVLFGLRARYGDGAAVLGSACLFGISHLNAVAAVYATAAGIVLGILALRTRSTWPGIAMHAAVNAMPVLLPERLFPLRGFNVPSVEPTHLGLWLVLPTLLLGGLLLAWVDRIEYAEDR